MNAKILFSRPSLALALALLMAVVSAMLAFAVPTAEATQGFPMYSWGFGASGRLGLGDPDDLADRDVPSRIPGPANWVFAASAGNGSFAINTEGHLYAWGQNRLVSNMGQGGAGASALLVSPTRVGTASNWEMVSSRTSTVAAINSSGHLYTWGANGSGQLGHGDTLQRWTPARLAGDRTWATVSVGGQGCFMVAITTQGHLYAWGGANEAPNSYGRIVPGGYSLEPVRIGTASNWRMVSSGAGYAAAITTGGHIYTWGLNASGQLGHGDFTNRFFTPTRIESIGSGWTDVRTTNTTTAALNSAGEIWTWGSNSVGQVGIGTTGGSYNAPQRVGDASDWVRLMGGNSHFIAMNTRNEIYSWGNNAEGQLGVGDTNNRNEPILVGHVEIAVGAALGGGLHSIALLDGFQPGPATPPEVSLSKRLRLPEGTPIPTTAFTFTFERNSHNNIEANYHFLPVIPNRVINITPTSLSTTAGGITTVTVSVDALAGIEFDRPGAFSYIVREVQSAPGIGANSTLTFSPAVYELRIYIVTCSTTGDFEFYTKTLTPLTVDNDTQTVGVKTDNLVFTNTYVRTTTSADGALSISKRVDGLFADLSTLFDFDITLTAAALSGDSSFAARVYNENGTFANRTYTFQTGVEQRVQLLHGQRLVFNTLTVGTTFAVTERAALSFIASALLYVNGSQVSVTPNESPNLPFPIGSHIVGAGTNSAVVINTHDFVPPTGLSLANAPWIALGAAALTLTLTLVVRKRRTIEELPVVLM